MGAMIDLWRSERQARPFFAAITQGALAQGAGYVAVMLIAYERLGSAWAASLILLADIAPSMLLGPLVGAWLDRRDRLRCAIAADLLRAVALVAMIVVPGALSLLALAVLIGVGNTIFRPAVFALLPAVVSSERRAGANALYGALCDAGMMVGPALAAPALVLGGPSVLLAVNAVAFTGSALALSRVRLVTAPEREAPEEDSLLDSAREGVRFVRRERVLRLLVVGTGVIVLAAGMMNVAEVLLAKRELGVGGAGFAAMVAVFGVGAVLGSLAAAHSTTPTRLKRGYVGGLVVLAIGLIGSALAPSLGWAIASFFVTGVGNALSMTHDRGLMQHLVPERMLSRVYSLNGTIESWGFAGAALLGGTLASTLGARGVFAVSGLALAIVALVATYALLRLDRRPLSAPTPLAA
jgi:MFS family permease